MTKPDPPPLLSPTAFHPAHLQRVNSQQQQQLKSPMVLIPSRCPVPMKSSVRQLSFLWTGIHCGCRQLSSAAASSVLRMPAVCPQHRSWTAPPPEMHPAEWRKSPRLAAEDGTGSCRNRPRRRQRGIGASAAGRRPPAAPRPPISGARRSTASGLWAVCRSAGL